MLKRLDHKVTVIFTNDLDIFTRRGWILSLAIYFFIMFEELDQNFTEYFVSLDRAFLVVFANTRQKSKVSKAYGRRSGVLDSASWYSICIISKMLDRIL